MKEIKNRRQDVVITDIDPVIETVSGIETQLSTDGFVKKTDYASTSNGGTIKLDNGYATDITAAGKLKAKEISASDYATASDNAFIGKATLDNLIAAGTLGGGGIDTLWEEDDESPTACTAGEGVTLTHTSVDYKFLVVVLRRSDKSLYVPSLFITSVQNALIAPAGINNNGNAVPVVASLNGTAITLPNDTGMGSLYWHKVYGIK